MRATVKVRDRVELTVDTFGEESAPMLLLIAGAGAPAVFWPDAFCEKMAEQGLFVVRYDHRDTGSSTHFDEPYDMDELLHDIMGLLNQFDNAAVHLAGHSMGGYLAQMAMTRYPDRFVSVTSISAGSTVSPEISEELGMSTVADETWGVLMENQPKGVFEADLAGWLNTWRFLNGQRPFDEEMATAYTRALYQGDPRNAQVAINHVHAMTTVPDSLVKKLHSVTVPFMVMHGTEDPLVPFDNGEASATLVPDSTLVSLEGVGHMFFDVDTWDAIASVLLSHITASAE